MKYFHSMYYVAISVLIVAVAVESIGRGFPVNVVVAVLTTSIVDVAIKRLWRTKVHSRCPYLQSLPV